MLREYKMVDPCLHCRRMRLKRNYKFQMYEDSIKGQAPAAGQAADAHLRAHLPLPGQHFLDSLRSESPFNSVRANRSCLAHGAMRCYYREGTFFHPSGQCPSCLLGTLSHGPTRE